MNQPKRWSTRDDGYLRAAWCRRPLPRIAQSLARTQFAVCLRARRIGLAADEGTRLLAGSERAPAP